jgi:sucrose phosphorylase
MLKKDFSEKVKQYLFQIYSNDLSKKQINNLFLNIKSIFTQPMKRSKNELWSEKDFLLITYADSIKKNNQKNLITLNSFLKKYCKEFSYIHILPFFPFSSDDGFAVEDYKKIKIEHGSWKDLKKITKTFDIMVDLVINHCSSNNKLFKNFLEDKNPGKDFFINSEKKFPKSNKIVRPRSSDLSKKVLVDGKNTYVWCTFGHDQVDFDFRNPNVLLYFFEIIKFYLDQDIKALRLDAVAFLWKELGTRCINLPQTHNIIRLIRLIIDRFYNKTLIITETNIPSHENLTYFGNNNEAHCIYNFSLAPLLIHAVVSGNSFYLKKWSRGMPPAQENNSYLNFLSTHDGIGMRPVEGILPENEIQKYFNFFKKQGGLFSYRTNAGKKSVYEVNITLLEAFKECYNGKDKFVLERFILAHTILFSMEGIPAIYIQNYLGSKNDNAKVKKTNSFRSINRRNWNFDSLVKIFKNKSNINSKILHSLNRLMVLRKKQIAFHPNATQFTLQLGDIFFGIWRQSIDRSQSIFCISNLTNVKQKISLLDINLISTNNWFDILSNKKIKNIGDELLFKPYQTFWITNKKI